MEYNNLKERMLINDQINFRAIVDIDGNDWSGRLCKLVRTNSAVIKVRVHIYICFSASQHIDEKGAYTYVLVLRFNQISLNTSSTSLGQWKIMFLLC